MKFDQVASKQQPKSMKQQINELKRKMMDSGKVTNATKSIGIQAVIRQYR